MKTKLKVTISEEGYLTLDNNRNYQTYINNSDNIELSFYELYEYLLKLSTKTVTNKKFGLPRLYQTYRKDNPSNNIFLQGDDSCKTNKYNILTLDYDNSFLSREDIENKLTEYEYISYYSYSHSIKDNNRFRILINLNSELNLKEINNKIKEDILTVFTFEGNKPDSASIKDGWMGLPAKYDGERESIVRYNRGTDLNIKETIDRIIMENKIKQITRTKISNSVYNEKIYNFNRQKMIMDECISDLNSMIDGEIFNTIQGSISKLALAGIDKTTIEDLVLPYESNIKKFRTWEEWIEKCVNSYNPIKYFNRFEIREFEGDTFIFDNQLSLYKDEVTEKWLKFYPRNNNEEYKTLYDSNKLYKFIYDIVGDYKMSAKVKTFIELIMSRLTEETHIAKKNSDMKMLKGVKLRYSEWKNIQFHIFKFRDILVKTNNDLKEIKIVEDKNNEIDILDIFTLNDDKSDEYNNSYDFLFNEDKDVELQQKVLKALKELIYYRYDKVYGKNTGERFHYFSPKTKTLDLLDEKRFRRL